MHRFVEFAETLKITSSQKIGAATATTPEENDDSLKEENVILFYYLLVFLLQCNIERWKEISVSYVMSWYSCKRTEIIIQMVLYLLFIDIINFEVTHEKKVILSRVSIHLFCSLSWRFSPRIYIGRQGLTLFNGSSSL